MPSVENIELVFLLSAVILKPGISIRSSITSCKSEPEGSELCPSAEPSARARPRTKPFSRSVAWPHTALQALTRAGEQSLLIRRWRFKCQQVSPAHPGLRNDRNWLEIAGFGSLFSFACSLVYFPLKDEKINSAQAWTSCSWNSSQTTWWTMKAEEYFFKNSRAYSIITIIFSHIHLKDL